MLSKRVKTAIAAVSIAIMTAVSGAAADATGTRATSGSVADPGFTRVGSTWYLAATGSLDVFSRTSPVGTYTKIGTIDAKVGGVTDYWAPHLVKRGAYWFAFFTARPSGGKPCIYWASTARSQPTGGFSDARKLTCAPTSGWEAIDSSTYVTTEGNTYLLWRNGIHSGGFPNGNYDIVARMLTFSGSVVTFKSGSTVDNLLHRTNDKVYEAPSMVRHGGKVWLFVSRDRYDTNAYHTDVYSADTIHGTFTWRKTLMKTGQGFGYGPGGAEVETASDGSTYIAWHSWASNKPYPSTAGTRITKTAKLNWVNGLPVVG